MPLPLSMDRRSLLATASAAMGALAAGAQTAPRAFGPGAQPVRYPDPDIVTLDPRFKKYALGNTPIQRVATGFLWAEGPAWNGVGRYLMWSDIPNDRILRWDEESGVVGLYRKPSGFANGNTRDRQGRLVTAEHGRRVTRTEYDGRITLLMDRFDGKRITGPNDVVVKSDDSIWFTDMIAGIAGNWNGEIGEQELPQRVYRIDGKTGKCDRARGAEARGARSGPRPRFPRRARGEAGQLGGNAQCPPCRSSILLPSRRCRRSGCVRHRPTRFGNPHQEGPHRGDAPPHRCGGRCHCRQPLTEELAIRVVTRLFVVNLFMGHAIGYSGR